MEASKARKPKRQRESELLDQIAALSDYETAEAAADIYAAEKHAYSFDGYLYQLDRLRAVLAAGIPPETAIEAVDTCLDTEKIIHNFRGNAHEQNVTGSDTAVEGISNE